MGTSTFDAITVTGSGNGGVSMTNTTGHDDVRRPRAHDDPAPRPPSCSPTPAPCHRPGGGTANVSATGGPAVDVTGTSGATLAFDDVSSTNSAGDGINLAGLGAGTFTRHQRHDRRRRRHRLRPRRRQRHRHLPRRTQQRRRPTASRSPAAAAAPSPSPARSPTPTTPAAASLSGNTGGSTTFSNAIKTLNTGSQRQRSRMAASDGHTLDLTGGGLDIDTTSGAGLARRPAARSRSTAGQHDRHDAPARPCNVVEHRLSARDARFQSHLLERRDERHRARHHRRGRRASHVTGNGGTCTAADRRLHRRHDPDSTGADDRLTSAGRRRRPDTDDASTAGGDDGIRATTVGGGLTGQQPRRGNGNAVSEHGLDSLNVSGSSTVSGSTISRVSATINARTREQRARARTRLARHARRSSDATSTDAGNDGIELRRRRRRRRSTRTSPSSTFSANRDDGFQLASTPPAARR